MNLEELYNTHKNLVFNLALSYVHNVQDAEEITQDVFVSIHFSMHTFKAESKFTTWMYRITINKSLDFIKARQRKKRFAFITSLFYEDSSELKHDHRDFDHPGVILENKEATARIFHFIDQLPPNQKTVLILNKIEQKSINEIAEILNMSYKAIESLLQRAKTNLAIKLKSNEGYE
ncbi:MAG TPA: RNA polymerase sigma factor [Bacteroidia bacterium]|nr:RNA polymerase sigma factor [Bacteroidia bacterium]